jgi:hypothetical protein
MTAVSQQLSSGSSGDQDAAVKAARTIAAQDGGVMGSGL